MKEVNEESLRISGYVSQPIGCKTKVKYDLASASFPALNTDYKHVPGTGHKFSRAWKRL